MWVEGEIYLKAELLSEASSLAFDRLLMAVRQLALTTLQSYTFSVLRGLLLLYPGL